MCGQGVNFLGSMLKDYIKWSSSEEIPHVVEDFKNITAFPGGIFGVDCCHIHMKAPEDVLAYFIDMYFQCEFDGSM